MKFHALSTPDILKALGVGIVTSLLLSAVMVPAFKLGISPMPKPPSLAFAETVLGRSLPLPVGLLFHVAYVTAWSVIFVFLFRDRLSFGRALTLALVLWLVAVGVFFPVIGWGFFGLGVSPRLVVAALVPHVLFAIFLWLLCKAAFSPRTAAAG